MQSRPPLQTDRRVADCELDKFGTAEGQTNPERRDILTPSHAKLPRREIQVYLVSSILDWLPRHVHGSQTREANLPKISFEGEYYLWLPTVERYLR